jgi:hypothetical protein
VTTTEPQPGDDRHRCPGGCGRPVSNRFFACGPDWARLPDDVRAEIWRTAGRSTLDPERAAAIAAAVEFYAASR